MEKQVCLLKRNVQSQIGTFDLMYKEDNFVSC